MYTSILAKKKVSDFSELGAVAQTEFPAIQEAEVRGSPEPRQPRPAWASWKNCLKTTAALGLWISYSRIRDIQPVPVNITIVTAHEAGTHSDFMSVELKRLTGWGGAQWWSLA